MGGASFAVGLGLGLCIGLVVGVGSGLAAGISMESKRIRREIDALGSDLRVLDRDGREVTPTGLLKRLGLV